MTALTPAELREVYKQERPRLKEQTRLVGDLIRRLLDARGLGYSLESRTKSVDNFCEKAFREGKNYREPLQNILDISGIRVVTLLRRDVEQILDLLRSEFDIDDANSVDKGADFDVNEFGYRSKHLILRLDAQRRAQQEYGDALGWVEVQVRTAAQHTWALLDTVVRYKAAADPPPQLQRRLYGLAALLELVDRENESIIEGWQLFQVELANQWINHPLDSTFLTKYLESSEVMASLSVELATLGLEVVETGNAALCLRVCEAAGMTSGLALDAFLQETATDAHLFFEQFVATFVEGESIILDRATVAVLLVAMGNSERFTEASLRDEFNLGSAWRIVFARQHYRDR